MSRMNRSGFQSFNFNTEDLSELACGKRRTVPTPYCSSDKCCEVIRDKINPQNGKKQKVRYRKVMILKAGLPKQTRVCPDCSHSLKWVME
jgi:hypothetical protein